MATTNPQDRYLAAIDALQAAKDELKNAAMAAMFAYADAMSIVTELTDDGDGLIMEHLVIFGADGSKNVIEYDENTADFADQMNDYILAIVNQPGSYTWRR